MSRCFSSYMTLSVSSPRQTQQTFGVGGGGVVTYVHVCLSVYQLSASMTPEPADSQGQRSRYSLSGLPGRPQRLQRKHTHTHTETGECGLPLTRLISPLGLGSRQKCTGPKHTHTGLASSYHGARLSCVTRRVAADMLSHLITL